MDRLEHLLTREQFSVPADEKSALLLPALNELTAHHREHGQPYRRMLDALDRPGAARPATSLADVPYLPVSLFKWLELRSIEADAVFKVLRSSGTTGQVPSSIALDVATARLQTRALSSIVTHYVGGHRLPMLVVDHPGVVRDRRNLTARGAGILGMSSFGRAHHYLLTDDGEVDHAGLREWLATHHGQPLLVFGFTFMVWQHLYGGLRAAAGDGIDLSRAVLVHSGGWKKLIEQAVDNAAFKTALADSFGLRRVHNFYGMVEQVGGVFFECPAGFLHPPNFAEVLVRDPRDWDMAPIGRPGVIEVLSLLPRSYPGHALLTEDTGVVHGVDDCPCGRMGTRFTVSGRIPKAEIRGCSDVIAAGAGTRG